ncbi:uncharacterized protein LOC144548567 [Carex rostrata]
MATGGKGGIEKLRRCFRTVFFMLTMVASLFVASAPALVALGDVTVSVVLALRLTSAGGHHVSMGVRTNLREYGFRTSLLDIPIVSIFRSLIITCVYSLCDGPGLSHGPYLGTVSLCALISVLVLSIKACLYTPYPSSDIGPQAPPSLPSQRLHMRKSWGMPVLFLSSLVFALGHVVVAYRTSCRARKKLLFHRSDPEAVLGGKKVPRSPLPFSTKFYSKSDSETRRRGTLARDDHDLPISCLADSDSHFITINGISIHFKLSLPSLPSPHSLSSPCSLPPSDNTFSNVSLYTPLLSETVPDEVSNDVKLGKGEGDNKKFGVVLVHGFGGGVFSWRHVSGVLARQLGVTVVAFDRPGWGLTSRPRRKDWEERRLPNPYKLESQVELLISFCTEMGLSSVVFVGHDDGGLLALKATERIQASRDSSKVEVKGVVLISSSLSREVVPGFARILLHTPLGKKHMVRPLLRTEITQVVNRRAWYDSTKLTTEILSLYKMPLFVEGWDEALHEIGRMSFATVLSAQRAADLLKTVHDLPILVIAGAEDVLVSLKSAQAMASKFANSRLVAISGCGHLPHEECPKALLSALSPFISRLNSSEDVSQIH